MQANTPLDIYDFTDYREYLNAYYHHKKSEFPHFSHRYFSRQAGLGGSYYLSMIMSGQRNLSANSIPKFIKALKLEKRESAYFEAMVYFTQAKTARNRDEFWQRLIELKPKHKISQLEQDQISYFTQKHVVIIREMMALPDFREDIEWIASNFHPQLKKEQVTSAIETLLRLGLAEHDANGKLRMKNGTVASPAETSELNLFHYHRTVLRDASEAILSIPCHLREINSMTVPVPLSKMETIKNIMRKCQEEIVHLLNQSNEPFDDVFQVNMQCFPVTISRHRRVKAKANT